MIMGTTYRYARVSTDGQTLDAQMAALWAAGAERTFREKQSGAKSGRVALSRALFAPAKREALWGPLESKAPARR